LRYTPITSALRKLREDDYEFKASLHYIARLYLRKEPFHL
jgi:hypothetical protein